MKIIDVKLDTVCGYTSTLPTFEEAEIAFAGKSNVGKSSLLNVLMKRKRLARVGETPGKTRTINFYKVLAEAQQGQASVSSADQIAAMGQESNLSASVTVPSASAAAPRKLRWKKDPTRQKGQRGVRQVQGSGRAARRQAAGGQGRGAARTGRKSFYLVDLPGYGFANVPLREKERWGQMIEKYLNTSPQLKLVFLLVDIRHEPNANDKQMYEWVKTSGFAPVIVATKADKVSRGAAARQTDLILRSLGAPRETEVIPFSALTGQGAEEIYRVIGKTL